MQLEKLFDGHPHVKNLLCTLGGILMYSLALDLFLVGNNIAAGGISGIAIVLTQVFPVSVGTLVFLMNVPILLSSLVVNGWRYTIGAIIGATVYSASIELFTVFPTLTGNPLVAAVYGGVIYGVGMALLTLGNGSTGGTDLLSRLMVKRFPAMSVGKMCAFIDGGVVILAMIAFGDIEVGLYAIITIAVCSIVSDRIVLGFERGSLCMIVTAVEPHHIADPLMQALGRAVTRLEGTGMYTNVNRNVMLLAVRPQEVPKVKRLLQSIDPNAFVMLLPANELIGGNFHLSRSRP